MAWSVEFSPAAARELSDLDNRLSKRILNFVQRLSSLPDPRSIGEALRGPVLGEFWKYRVGDYRLICKIEDDRLVVIVVRIGNRKEVYRR